MDLDPSLWETNESYLRSKDILSSLRVVNDCAERGIALISQFNSLVTGNEDQRQCLIKVVDYDRKRKTDIKKLSL